MLHVGQVVKAQVLELDIEKRRLRLGMRQLIPTSLDEYIAEHKEGDVVTGRMTDVSGSRAKMNWAKGSTPRAGWRRRHLRKTETRPGECGPVIADIDVAGSLEGRPGRRRSRGAKARAAARSAASASANSTRRRRRSNWSSCRWGRSQTLGCLL